MHNTFFICPTANCAYAIDSSTLNEVQLKVLRRTAKRCQDCGNLQRFMEQTSLPNIQTNQKSYGGTPNEKTTQKTSGSIPKSESQRRRAARYTGA